MIYASVHTVFLGGGRGGVLPYKSHIGLCPPPPPTPWVGFLCHFGVKTGIDFVHFGLELGVVFEGTTGMYHYPFNSK